MANNVASVGFGVGYRSPRIRLDAQQISVFVLKVCCEEELQRKKERSEISFTFQTGVVMTI